MALTKIDDRGLNTPIDLLDNEKIRFGSGIDLELHSDGENGHLTATQGNLWLRSDTNIFLSNEASNEYFLKATHNGAVELYHDHVKRLTTESWGTMLWGGQATIRGDEGGFAQLKLAADEGDDNLSLIHI